MTDAPALPTAPVRARRVSLLTLAMAVAFIACFTSPMLLSHYLADQNSVLLAVVNRSGMLSGHAGDSLLYQVDVTNVSPQPVRILGTQSSCGCTTVLDELPLTIEPRKTATLTVRLVLSDATGISSRSVRLLVNRNGIVPLMTVTATTLR